MWLKYIIIHILSRGPYLSSRKASNFASLLSPYKSCSSSTSEMMLQYLSLFSLWFSPVLCFYAACLHQSSYFFSLTWAMVGHSSTLLLLSVLHHCLQFGLESFWPGKSRHCTCAGEEHCPVYTAWGEGGCQVCTRVIGTSQTLPFALIGCVDLWEVDSCKSNYSHWVKPQWLFTQLTCILFYCHIIMAILANITKL